MCSQRHAFAAGAAGAGFGAGAPASTRCKTSAAWPLPRKSSELGLSSLCCLCRCNDGTQVGSISAWLLCCSLSRDGTHRQCGVRQGMSHREKMKKHLPVQHPLLPCIFRVWPSMIHPSFCWYLWLVKWF